MKRFYLLAVAILLGNCKNAHTTISPVFTRAVDLHHIKEAKAFNNSYANISMLYTYPTYHKCGSDTPYVNLYVCKNNDSGDTLLVLESCRPIPPYLYSDSRYSNTLSIASEDIRKIHPEIVYIDLPNQAKLPAAANYLFADLKILEE